MNLQPPEDLREETEADFTASDDDFTGTEALGEPSMGKSEGPKGPAEGSMDRIQRPMGLLEATFLLFVEPVAKIHPPVSTRDPLPL